MHLSQMRYQEASTETSALNSWNERTILGSLNFSYNIITTVWLNFRMLTLKYNRNEG